MELYFENSHGEMRLISTPNTVKQASKDIQNFLNEHNYKSYYTQITFSEDDIIFDVGSWSEFFHLKGFSEEDIAGFKGGNAS